MPHHPHKKRKNIEWFVLIIILSIAFVFRFDDLTSKPAGLHPEEAYSNELAQNAKATGEYKIFYSGNNLHNGQEGFYVNFGSVLSSIFYDSSWSLRFLSAIAGVLTVLGLYRLAKIIFTWQIAAISSFLLAISFWHVLFSRLGIRAILAPLFLVWALYYLWRAKQTHSLWHYGLSGLFWGIGIISYSGFIVMLIVLVVVLSVYWIAVQKHFWHARYVYIHHKILKGFSILLIVTFIVSLPMILHYMQTPEDIFNKLDQSPAGIISGSQSLGQRFLDTFNMLISKGDNHWLHNIPGMPALFWPVAMFFLFGLLRAFIKLTQHHDEHGHFSSSQVLLLSWFFVGMIPSMWAGNTPNAQTSLIISPVVFIFTAEGLWYMYEFIKKWYIVRDSHEVVVHNNHVSEGVLVGSIAIIVFLFAIALYSYQTYFDVWLPLVEEQNIFLQY